MISIRKGSFNFLVFIAPTNGKILIQTDKILKKGIFQGRYYSIHFAIKLYHKKVLIDSQYTHLWLRFLFILFYFANETIRSPYSLAYYCIVLSSRNSRSKMKKVKNF